MSVRSYFVRIPSDKDSNSRRINTNPVDSFIENTVRVRTETRLKRMQSDCRVFKRKYVVVKARCIEEAALFAFRNENIVLQG